MEKIQLCERNTLDCIKKGRTIKIEDREERGTGYEKRKERKEKKNKNLLSLTFIDLSCPLEPESLLYTKNISSLNFLKINKKINV